jgi:hypothetical protein
VIYNVATKKGKREEEDIVKISITAKRAGDEFDDYIKVLGEIYLEEVNKLAKLMAKKKTMKSN